MSKNKKKPEAQTVTGFKGFDKDLRCRGLQYEVGQTHEHDGDLSLCESGLHFCEHPLDCFSYYPPAISRYCEVSTDCASPEKGDDTKRVTKKLKIGAEISLAGLVKAAIAYTRERATLEDSASATGDWGAASATGDRGAASATGDWGAASATGDWGAASATGNQGAASATGYQGAASATGYQGAASATGENSVALAAGYESKAKGARGCAICCVERDDEMRIVAVKASIVDGKKIKENTWYRLKDGEFAEVKE